jgi:hypothetical protein
MRHAPRLRTANSAIGFRLSAFGQQDRQIGFRLSASKIGSRLSASNQVKSFWPKADGRKPKAVAS